MYNEPSVIMHPHVNINNIFNLKSHENKDNVVCNLK